MMPQVIKTGADMIFEAITNEFDCFDINHLEYSKYKLEYRADEFEIFANIDIAAQELSNIEIFDYREETEDSEEELFISEHLQDILIDQVQTTVSTGSGLDPFEDETHLSNHYN